MQSRTRPSNPARLGALAALAVTLWLPAGSALAQAAQSLKLQVNGMVCSFCAQGIEKRLKAMPETGPVFIDLRNKVVAVEPRPVVAASTSFWCEPPPRRSLRRERAARELLALSKMVHDTRQLAALVRQAQQARPSVRRAREARQLQEVMLLAAALRRAGFPR